MLIKKLSKIGLSLLLAASFIMPAYAVDWSTTDQTHLKNADENTYNTYVRLGSTNTHLNNINTKLTNIYNDVGNIENAVTNTIASTINTISTTLTSIKGYVDQLEGYVDGVESKLDTISGALATSNGNWVTLGNYIDAIYNTDAANGTVLTDIYNLLNGGNSPDTLLLKDIRWNMAILKDNICVFRLEQSNPSVTLSNSFGLDNVTYNLYAMTTKQLSVTDYRISISNGTRYYVNFNGMWAMRINELYYMCGQVGNLISAQIDNLLTDTGYIGTELHLTYQLLDAFKSANHTDITSFATANHTDITDFISLFKQYGLRFMLFWDNMTVYRSSNTQDTITSSFAGLEGSYTLKAYTDYSSSFTANTGLFELTSSTKYGNTLGILCSYPRNMVTHFRSYLGYLNDNNPASTITNSVAALDQNLTQLEQAESQVTTSAIQRINNFLPDPNSIGALSALSWGSNFLQRIFVALGAFNIPILCALVLSVCMQFIGYFKYKT